MDLPRPSPVASSAWTTEDVAAFPTAIRDDHLAVLYRLLVLTGLRSGEAAGLRWSDLDLLNGTLTVHRQVVHVAGDSSITSPARTISWSSATMMVVVTAHPGLVRARVRAPAPR